MAVNNGVEWVDFEPREGQRIAFYERYNRMGQIRAWARAQATAAALAQPSSVDMFAETLDQFCEALAELVADWDLESETGQALPRPTSGAAFYDLTMGEEGETAWIMDALRKRLAPDPE